MNKPIKTVIARVEGKVQGVWYRGWTAETANELDLSGWVRNMPDGSVEALFSGQTAQVDEMLVRCYDGPRFANVRFVKVNDAPKPVGDGFIVKR